MDALTLSLSLLGLVYIKPEAKLEIVVAPRTSLMANLAADDPELFDNSPWVAMTSILLDADVGVMVALSPVSIYDEDVLVTSVVVVP